jgi:hypothetical protein
MGLIAETIACLLRWSAVVRQPVSLDDQAEIGPEEVDTEATDVLPRQRVWQSRFLDDAQEAALELGVGESKNSRPTMERSGPTPRTPG